MGNIAKAETLLKYAAKRTAATVKKHDNRKRNTFVAWTVNALLETYRDPRAILLEIASTDTHKLAEQAGITPGDALAERRLCAQAVLPYVAQKLPVQVDMRHTKAIHLNIVTDEQYVELTNLADADTNHVQLIQGHVIDETSTPPVTAETRPSHEHAHLPDSSGMVAAAAKLDEIDRDIDAGGVEHTGLGLRETDE